jgi:primase-polymerase (primpol)-like protein
MLTVKDIRDVQIVIKQLNDRIVSLERRLASQELSGRNAASKSAQEITNQQTSDKAGGDLGTISKPYKDLNLFGSAYIGGNVYIKKKMVLTEQQALIDDPLADLVGTPAETYTVNEQTILNSLIWTVNEAKDRERKILAALRAHGLIAT